MFYTKVSKTMPTKFNTVKDKFHHLDKTKGKLI